MKAPRWALVLLRFVAPGHREDDVVGDVEEAHRRRMARRGPLVAWLVTSLDALDLGFVILRDRLRGHGPDSLHPADAANEDLLSGFSISWLDFKLGFRMLVRYPGLTVVAGLSIAFAIAVGAANTQWNKDFIYPSIPLDEGDRIVEIRNQDISRNRIEVGSLHDFVAWRDGLRSVQEVGAYQTFQRNLITEQGRAEPLVGAEITAAAFGVARTPPLLGRALAEADETVGAPHVLVISFDVWQSHFDGDPEVVGRMVHLAGAPTTIIGVMPEGFGWPWSQDLWAPLRINPLDFQPGQSPAVQVVARLAPGVSLGQAQAELSAIGLRASADRPETHEHLRPEVVRFGRPPVPMSGLAWAGAYVMALQVFAIIMFIVWGNVTLLLVARTAAREDEIVVRSALGASRRRITMQLFAEALVLGGVAVAMGLWGAQVGVRWVVGVFSRAIEGLEQVQGGLFGFWVDGSLSGEMVAYAFVFTVVAAAFAATIPVLPMTGSRVQPRMRHAGAGELGRGWSAVIVAQIALTVAFLPLVVVLGGAVAGIRGTEYGFPAEEYLSVQLAADHEFYSAAAAFRGDPRTQADGRYGASLAELKMRLADEPGVVAVTATGQIPGGNHPLRRIEVEGASAAPRPAGGHRAQVATVDLDFFDALAAPVLAGRAFGAADADSDNDVVMVNEAFVRRVLDGRNPIGRHLTFVDRRRRTDPSTDSPSPRYRIIGVVKQIAMAPPTPELPEEAPGVYRLLARTEAYPLYMVVRVGSNPESFAPRLTKLAGEVDPSLQLLQLRPLSESAWATELLYGSYFWVVTTVGAVGLLLATAGIFSVMSFTVARRTREIGVRVALGADSRQIVSAIFSRSFKQVGWGIAAGGVLLLLALLGLPFSGFRYRPDAVHVALLAAYLPAMFCVCLLACVVPMKRALAVEPAEALRA